MILESVAAMLRNDPRAPLTMARAAEAVNASPMSLYRYFGDREDLVVCVTRHVLRDSDTGIPADAPWTDRLRSWMTTVYERGVAHPQLFELAASGESPAWLTCSARLVEILETAGFADDERLAAAVYLIGTITLGQAMVAAASGEEMSPPRLYAEIGHLTADEAQRVSRLIPHLANIGSGGFELIVEWTVNAVTGLASERARPAKKVRAR